MKLDPARYSAASACHIIYIKCYILQLYVQFPTMGTNNLEHLLNLYLVKRPQQSQGE